MDLGWYIEHTKNKRGTIRRTAPTLWMLLIPNRFWKRVSIDRPVFLRCVWGWVAASVVLAYLRSVILSIAVAAHHTAKWDALVAKLQSPQTTMSNPHYWTNLIISAISNLFAKATGLTQNGTHFTLLLCGILLMWVLSIPPVPMTRRVDTPVEIEYFRNGGILHTVIRKKRNEAKQLA